MTSAIDLNPTHLDLVERILAEHVPGCEVRAFGSRAAWTARDYSDVDLAVVGDGPLHWRTLSRLREAFEESRLPMRVDVLDWHAISDGFRETIRSDCVVVQEANVPVGWPRVRLADLVTLTKGLSYKSAFLNEGGPDLIGLGQFIPGGGAKLEAGRTYAGQYRDKDVARPGDVLIAMTDLTQQGSVLGSPLMVPSSVGDFCLYTLDAGKIEPDEGLDTQFLYYLLKNQDFRSSAAAHATGTTVRRVRPVDVLAYEFPLPPLEEQRAIARVLGALDDRIELNRRMSETIEEMARALFRSWFVDFDPVRAKAEGRPSGLPPHLDALFPASFEASELGDIPAGWEVKTLGEVAREVRESVSPDRVAADMPYIGLDHMPRRSIVLSEWGTAGGLASNKSRFSVGDVLFGKLRPYFHKVGIAPVDGVCSTDIVVLAPTVPDWFSFMLGHVSSDEFVDYTDAASTGTKMPRTKWKDMKRYPVSLSGQAVAAAFNECVQPLIANITADIGTSRTLAAQRDALLPRLLSGELRVDATPGEASA